MKENQAAKSFDPGTQGRKVDEKAFIAPAHQLDWHAPFGWLKLGWQDYRKVPRISWTYGLIVFVVSALMTGLAWIAGGWVLLIAALTGFVFVAPLLAFALYSVSRQLCQGTQPSLRKTLRAIRRPFSNAMVFGLALLIIFLVWARAGSMVHIFFPVESEPSWTQIGTFLAIGSAVGAVFAGFTFAATAFSLPMLANREVDVVTAVVSSINAVLRNKRVMVLWAILIVLLTTLGILTGLLGLIVVIPWLGYATWHAYRETLDVSAWGTLPVVGRDE
ncbi:MAG TPA: DUF2189 domain-containing protein [Xanthomonadales bacterium]|nr:DUF2189 domain-containing protein [Xanthomonadales bacterium]